MEISGVSGWGGGIGGGEVFNMDKETGRTDFLTMLVAQLKNQDPLNPMNGTDFTAQLAQFSSLEQLMGVNKNLDGLQLIQSSQNNATMTNMIGKIVTAKGNGTYIKDGKSMDITYELDSDALAVNITIYDSNGIIVKRISETNGEKGLNSLSWDAENDSGASLSDGTYSYTVAATSSSGEDINTSTLTKGEITSISYNEDGSTSLWMGEMGIALNRIIKISAPEDNG